MQVVKNKPLDEEIEEKIEKEISNYTFWYMWKAIERLQEKYKFFEEFGNAESVVSWIASEMIAKIIEDMGGIPAAEVSEEDFERCEADGAFAGLLRGYCIEYDPINKKVKVYRPE